MTVDGDTAVVVINLARGEAERIDIGNAAGAIDHPVSFDRLFDALVSKDDAESSSGCLDSLDPDVRPDLQSDPLAFGLQRGDRIRVHGGQELRQRFQNRNPAAGARVHMAELQRDHAASDEDHGFRAPGFAQHVIRGEHVLGSGRGFDPVAITMWLA